ncbi:hypothetical protein Syun_027338 [Stephania yunnanensis]|uniref:Uncharacterized protein n=1 Tax=Stephania yunnanensis TaxID=152371 RepID=A0AAP0HPV9_9MAGN
MLSIVVDLVRILDLNRLWLQNLVLHLALILGSWKGSLRLREGGFAVKKCEQFVWGLKLWLFFAYVVSFVSLARSSWAASARCTCKIWAFGRRTALAGVLRKFAYKKGMEWKAGKMLLPYKQLCSEKKESDRLRQVIEKEMLKVETLMVECGDRHYKFDVSHCSSTLALSPMMLINGSNSVSDPSLISNGSETEIIRNGIYSVSDPSLNQRRNPFSVSDPISDDVFRDGTHSVSVPFLIAIRDGIFAN